MIRCELQHHALVNSPKYIALSYCWGHETNKRPVMVGGVRVFVTANLEEALQQLREFGVTLLWVDALCINQADKQEKSLQVRNMKQVYAKAEATYAWLGPSEYDDALPAIRFLQRIVSDFSLLEEISHSQTAARRESFEELSLLSEHNADTCTRCGLETSFRQLLDLYERPYWRRRWVIQEVTTSMTLLVLCGSERIDLDEMSRALHRCSDSKYWQPQHESAIRFLRRILYFRKSYHDGRNIKLCRTILKTQDSLSKDDRDKVFALIGICKDANELVPTPSYYLSTEHIAAEITREVLRRNARFDLILADQQHRSISPGQLPTWCPNWFSERLSEDACILAEKPPYLNRWYGAHSLRGDINTLHVQGVEMGTVVATTSILSSSSYLPTMMACSSSTTFSTNRHTSGYYGKQTLAAILTCLLAPNTKGSAPIAIDGSVHRHHLLQASRGFTRYRTRRSDEEKQEQTHSARLHQWLVYNGGLLIHGRRLRDWVQESPMRYYLHVPYVISHFQVLGIVLAFPFIAEAIAVTWLDLDHMGRCLAAWIVLSLCFSVIFAWETRRHTRETVKKAMKHFPQGSARLILLNTGALGMAYADVEIRDKVCLIAGCTESAVILRERRIGHQMQHAVVGKSMVCMSRDDWWNYCAFFRRGLMMKVKGQRTVFSQYDGLYRRPVQWLRWWLQGLPNDGRLYHRVLSRISPFQESGIDYELNSVEYNKLIDEYKLRNDWKGFVLI